MTCPGASNWSAFPLAAGSWTYFNETTSLPDFTQPVQGSFPNCTLVSALIALSWVNKDFIKNKMGTTAFTNGYTFWDGATPVKVKINNELQVDPAGSLARCGAYSKYAYELWPSFIEKAYAKFCQYKANPATYPLAWLQNPANNPNLITTLLKVQWGGNPTTALAYLSGCTKYNVKVADPLTHCTNGSSVSLFDYIKTCLCTTSAGVNVWRTIYPSVAWTFESGAQFTGTCGIFANHCYALLGIVEYGGTQYVVLRDSFGVDPAGCNVIPDTAPWTYMDSEYNICTRYAVPLGKPSASNQWVTRVFTDKSDAVFGLPVNDFKTYFEWFGYVK